MKWKKEKKINPCVGHELMNIEEEQRTLLTSEKPVGYTVFTSDSTAIKGALRYNQGKPQYSLLDLKSLEPCVRVLEFGANKYARDNWKKGMPREQIIDSMMRHLAALIDGEEIDPESGLSHIGHIQCNALFLGNKNNT